MDLSREGMKISCQETPNIGEWLDTPCCRSYSWLRPRALRSDGSCLTVTTCSRAPTSKLTFVGSALRCSSSAGELECNMGMRTSHKIVGESEAADLRPEAEVCPRSGTSRGLETLILRDPHRAVKYAWKRTEKETEWTEQRNVRQRDRNRNKENEKEEI